jgi:hypothetical protein
MILNLRPTPRQLRRFGVVALVGFGILGGWTLWKGGLFGADFGAAGPTVAYALLALGGLSGLLAIVYPRGNLPVFVGLTLLTFPIGWVVSHVILGLLFWVVLVPVGLVLRLLGRDALSRTFDESAETYWTDVKSSSRSERYFQQF